MDVEVTLRSDAAADELERLKQVVETRCPVLDLFRNATPVRTSLVRASTEAAAE